MSKVLFFVILTIVSQTQAANLECTRNAAQGYKLSLDYAGAFDEESDRLQGRLDLKGKKRLTRVSDATCLSGVSEVVYGCKSRQGSKYKAVIQWASSGLEARIFRGTTWLATLPCDWKNPTKVSQR